MIEIIEKIEGEAKLDFYFENGMIDFVQILFDTTKGVEKILQGKDAFDALVINPRVCGICNHAHLIATVRALEDCYDDIQISSKAQHLREITLNFEIIHNHFKWFYLVMLPLFQKPQNIQKTVEVSSLIAKAIALIAGQYPHNSYAVVGGVSSEITNAVLVEILQIMKEIEVRFKMLIDTQKKDFWECDSIERMLEAKGEFPQIAQLMLQKGFGEYGKSYDRFLVFGQSSYFKKAKSHKTTILKNLKYKHVKESLNENSLAKNVTYKNRYYEVGALARAMVNKTPLIKDCHRKFSDSTLSRVSARVCEIAQLLHHNQILLQNLNLNEPSYIKPKQSIKSISAQGIGSVEAARGSLIHEVHICQGVIQKYKMITPTQWNLSNGSQKHPGVAQKAMIGLQNKQEAQIVFKSFDVCSVCTTH